MGVMAIILFIFIVLVPVIKEDWENEKYRQECLRKGQKTYWSNTGIRYTSDNKKVTSYKDYNK